MRVEVFVCAGSEQLVTDRSDAGIFRSVRGAGHHDLDSLGKYDFSITSELGGREAGSLAPDTTSVGMFSWNGSK